MNHFAMLTSSGNHHIKFIMTFLLLSIGVTTTNAQTDTSAYEVQRQKINQLLEQRSARFGQYDESLTKRTGIFGLKTKRDMQSSIDILTQIVQNDNEILEETKVLLEYKNFEQKEVETKVQVVEGRIDRFQTTIRNLQVQNDTLKDQLDKTESRNSRLVLYLVWLLIAFIAVLTWPKIKKLLKRDVPLARD